MKLLVLFSLLFACANPVEQTKVNYVDIKYQVESASEIFGYYTDNTGIQLFDGKVFNETCRIYRKGYFEDIYFNAKSDSLVTAVITSNGKIVYSGSGYDIYKHWIF